MVNIDMCEIGHNYSLGQVLGNNKYEKCWAVECNKDTPASLCWNGKYYRRFDSFKDAERFALSL